MTCTGYRLVQGLTLSSACTCTRHLKKTVPIYISDELNLYEPKRPLRSSYAGPLYTVSVGRKEVSDFDFAIKGPRLWNSLPMDLRQAPSVMTFKKRLKTYLFKRHYYSRD